MVPYLFSFIMGLLKHFSILHVLEKGFCTRMSFHFEKASFPQFVTISYRLLIARLLNCLLFHLSLFLTICISQLIFDI